MRFMKYHGLGNDYLVINPDPSRDTLRPDEIRLLCDRHFGVGSDGILWGPIEKKGDADFGVRIFNPDGSEAEKSGNGLRIFSRYLWDSGRVGDAPFRIWTPGGIVEAIVSQEGRWVEVEMGRVSFHSRDIPVIGPPREVIDETITIHGKSLRYCALTIGNPHCVVFGEEVSDDLVRRFGPLLETHPHFPNRTNVQFLEVLDRNRIRILIWERGAGYTLASGSSSCAAAAVAHRMGWCDSEITVEMPGGQLHIRISPEWQIRMAGPVTRVCEGRIDPELFTNPPCM